MNFYRVEWRIAAVDIGVAPEATVLTVSLLARTLLIQFDLLGIKLPQELEPLIPSVSIIRIVETWAPSASGGLRDSSASRNSINRFE